MSRDCRKQVGRIIGGSKLKTKVVYVDFSGHDSILAILQFKIGPSKMSVVFKPLRLIKGIVFVIMGLALSGCGVPLVPFI